ncbi:MAG: hypothetical protein IJH47_03750 [Oscillospiraceae bacterium]|nr:hypothetical protein [Oscillospiraceae bacterium]
MTREQIYTAQLKDLGVYHPAFDPAIRTLADLERDHQRTKKAWRAAGSAYDSDLYPVIERQRRDILAHRESLGLTPKGLRRLKATSLVPETSTAADARAGSPVVSALMASLQSQAAANAAVQNEPLPEAAHD